MIHIPIDLSSIIYRRGAAEWSHDGSNACSWIHQSYRCFKSNRL